MKNSGYHSCPCRDCFEIAIGCDENDNPDLCWECEEAGCEICDCIDPDRNCPHSDCQTENAYGG